MKTTLLSLVSILIALSLSAQSDKYIQTMERNIAQMDTTIELSVMQDLANRFIRVAEAEKEQWLPYYYAAYANINLAFMGDDPTKADAFLDQADTQLKIAQAMDHAKDEVWLLQAYAAQARIMVDPMTRGQKYGSIAGTLIEQARLENEENPRVYYLTGQSLLYTPEMWGGGKAAACPYIKQAAEKYEVAKPVTTIHPNWGKRGVTLFLKMCDE